MNVQSLPVAVIGAGPVGLAAAAHLIQRGETPIVFEAGNEIAANVRSWGHVSLFSPWRWCVDKAAVALLEPSGWQMPNPDQLPTGHELIDAYLRPLAELPQLRSQIHLNSRVTAISRRRIDKMKDTGRDQAPFILQATVDGQEERFLVRAVIDATGTWATPNPVGADGLFAPGERTHQDKIAYGIPDVLGKQRQRYLGKQVAVVGGGHSAINAILELMDLHEIDPATQIVWVLRRANVASVYGGLENDELPGRGLLGVRIKNLVDAGAVEVVNPFFTTHVEQFGERIQLIGDTPNGEQTILVDQVIAATGSRPDLSFLRELRLDLHNSVEAPTAIASLIDPNVHSCGSVPPHGEKELRHPEQNFYMVGMKSYGRAPTFLLATGYEQVRSIVAALVGDWQAAAEVQLELPETGVCGVPAAVDANRLASGSGCCGSGASKPAKELIVFDLPSTLQPLPFAAKPIELSPVLELNVVPTQANACCGVDNCCTPAATVAADLCCTPETKAALSTSAKTNVASCC
ncbi:MAG: NAD(P)-binding domain-containing protein [Caldilineaceae bacterium]